MEKCISSEGIKEPKDNKYRNQSDAQMKVSILRLRSGLPEGEWSKYRPHLKIKAWGYEPA